MANDVERIISIILPTPFETYYREESQFILASWQHYKTQVKKRSNTLNGKVFEALVSLALHRKGIKPFYEQAKIAFIPNVEYDIIIYTEEDVLYSLSLKTSLRERYKQADLEALALKNIFRKKVRSFLITLNQKEALLRKKNLYQMMALDDVLLADSPEFDELLRNIIAARPCKPPAIKLVT